MTVANVRGAAGPGAPRPETPSLRARIRAALSRLVPGLDVPSARRAAGIDALDALGAELAAGRARGGAVDRLAPPVGVAPSLPELLKRIAPPSETLTQRVHEQPYMRPPELFVGEPGAPLVPNTLDPARRYVWTLDPQGRFVVAPEVQPGFGVSDAQPAGRTVKHGDLCPSADGRRRGAARAGGELHATRDTSGAVAWTLDMSSSYSFNRADGKVLGADAAHATIAYLEAMGTPSGALTAGANTYDPLRKLAGRAFLLLERLRGG
jgi:hypothetical protein